MQVMYRGVQRFRAFVGSAPASALAKVSVEMLALRVVGVSHYSLNDAIFRERLRQGDPAVVTHEPDNKHDANAMAVYVQGKRIGYIPRELQHVAEPYLDGTHQWVLSKVGAFKPSDNNNNNSDHPHPSAATSSRSSSGHSKHATTSGETVAMRLIEHGLEEYVDVLREHDAVLGDNGITEDTLIRMGIARKIHRRRVLAAVAEPARVQGQKLVPYATLCHAQFWAAD
eukprot:gene3947-242_t